MTPYADDKTRPSAHEVTADGIRRAAGRIEGVAVRTPLLESDILNDRAGGRVLLKAEPLQKCGSFKFRGAYNRISQLTDDERARGIVAWSSGNHAQGVALAAARVGAKAAIVMPEDAPKMKRDKVKALGAEIVPYDRYGEDREAIGRKLAAERGSVLVPSYDDSHIIEGQGTLGLEIVEDARAMGATLDAVLVCCGGGGLTAGVAMIVKDMSPGAQVYAVEPEAFDDTGRSIEAGKRLSADNSGRSICDAILTLTPGALTFPILQACGVKGCVVSDDDALDAIAFAFRELKVVVEPGGAVALAAILSGKFDARGKTTAAVLSGGNVDPAIFERALARL